MEAINLNNILITLMSGGVLVAIINRLILSRDKKAELAAKFTEQLATVERELRGEIRTVVTELDNWKEKYYKLLDDYHKTLNDNQMLRGEVERLTKQMAELNSKLNRMQKS